MGGPPPRRKHTGAGRRQHIQVPVHNMDAGGKSMRRRFVQEAFVDIEVLPATGNRPRRRYVKLDASTRALNADAQDQQLLVCVDTRTNEPFPKGNGCWYTLSGTPERLVGVRKACGRKGPKVIQVQDLVLMTPGDVIVMCPQGKELDEGDPAYEALMQKRLAKIAQREAQQQKIQRMQKRRRSEKMGFKPLALAEIDRVRDGAAPEPKEPVVRVRHVLFCGSGFGLTLIPWNEFEANQQQFLQDFIRAKRRMLREVA
ncbi:MAG: hypothetical protein NT003_00915 [Candidatus Magasanikbacteria bacterium]|nr:hypothetical protein [Candidatus Magasanikbacteria bacterium]